MLLLYVLLDEFVEHDGGTVDDWHDADRDGEEVGVDAQHVTRGEYDREGGTDGFRNVVHVVG